MDLGVIGNIVLMLVIIAFVFVIPKPSMRPDPVPLTVHNMPAPAVQARMRQTVKAVLDELAEYPNASIHDSLRISACLRVTGYRLSQSWNEQLLEAVSLHQDPELVLAFKDALDILEKSPRT